MLAGDAERLAEPAGAGAEQPRLVEPAALRASARARAPARGRGSAPPPRSPPPRRRGSGTSGCRTSGRRTRGRAGRTSRRCAAFARGSRVPRIPPIVGLRPRRSAPPTPSTSSVDADQLGRDLVDAAREEVAREHSRRAVSPRAACSTTRAAARPAAEVGQVDPAAGGVLRQPLGERERLVEQRRAGASWPMSCRIVRSVREATIGSGNALDPDERPLAAAAFSPVIGWSA